MLKLGTHWPAVHVGETKIGISYAKLCQSVTPGKRILIADGTLAIEVVEILNERELMGR
jgi:pyruvate kinase